MARQSMPTAAQHQMRQECESEEHEREEHEREEHEREEPEREEPETSSTTAMHAGTLGERRPLETPSYKHLRSGKIPG
jgi:hypothetical protein